jgi:hypoxanthine phosphoribosyltransferase
MMAKILPDNVKPVLTEEAIAEKIKEMAAEISRDHVGVTPLMIGILKGGFIILADLIRAMEISVEIDFAQISSYGDETKSSGRIKVIKDITTPLAGRHVIVVEDIIDTGLTLKYYMAELAQRGPETLRLAALIDKPARQEYTPRVDYLGFTVPDGFLIGYGLDWAGKYRDLPGVYEVEEQGRSL